MTALEAEGTITSTDLYQWLEKWGLAAFTDQLQNHGIASPEDLKYIESEKQFEELLSSLSKINFLQKCKLKKAWKSVVPNPIAPAAQIYFLGDAEKKILNVLNERFTDLSKDIEYVQKSFNSFNESVVLTKKTINDNAEEMISMINNRKNELLNQIGATKDKNQKLFNEKLNVLDKINEEIKHNKKLFTKIGSDGNMSSTERLKELEKLLVMNMNSNDDEKQNDIISVIDDQCMVADKLTFTFNKQSFQNYLNSNVTVKCNELNTKWNLKLSESRSIRNTEFKFDVFNSTYFGLSENGMVATSKGGCHYSLISTNTPFNKGRHEWTVKLIQIANTHQTWNPSMGVVTDIANAKKAGMNSTNSGFKCFRYAYLWDNEAHKLRAYQNGNVSVNQCDNLSLKQGDVITMILDCEQWTLSFLQNNNQIGTLKLQPNETYHPMIYSCGCTKQQFKLAF